MNVNSQLKETDIPQARPFDAGVKSSPSNIHGTGPSPNENAAIYIDTNKIGTDCGIPLKVSLSCFCR